MTDMTDATEGFSLAALAGIDVSGVEEVRFELIPQGAYVFEVTDATIEEGEKKDTGDKRFEVNIELKVLEVTAVLEAGVDKDSLVGKTLKQKQFINSGKTQRETLEEIGRVKATVVDMGGDWGSNIVDNVTNLKGLTFPAKVTHQTDRNDRSIKYPRIKFDRK